MVRHIVSWNYRDGFTKAQNQEHAAKIKNGLESLKSEITGIVSLEVITDPLDTSNADLVLNSLFLDQEALDQYQVHEAHKKQGAFIGTVMQNRYCIDWKEEN